MNKFINLKNFLMTSEKLEVVMTFDELESIIGYSLPESAKRHRAYFANTDTHSISKAWMEAGYYVTDLDVYGQKIVFKKKEFKKEAIISTDVLLALLNSSGKPVDDYVVTVFSLFEALSIRGRSTDEIFSFVSRNSIKVVDYNYKVVSYESFYENLKTIEVSMRNMYNSIIKYSLLCCLINSFHGNTQNTSKIFSIFERESESYLLIDIPITNDSEIGLVLFKKMLSRIAVAIDKTLDASCLLEAFSKLDYSKMSLISISGLDNLKTNYCNYMLKRFIASCADKRPYIPFYLVVEMLNVDIMSSRKETIYLTMSDDNFKTLYGSIVNRVIRKSF